MHSSLVGGWPPQSHPPECLQPVHAWETHLDTSWAQCGRFPLKAANSQEVVIIQMFKSKFFWRLCFNLHSWNLCYEFKQSYVTFYKSSKWWNTQTVLIETAESSQCDIKCTAAWRNGWVSSKELVSASLGPIIHILCVTLSYFRNLLFKIQEAMSCSDLSHFTITIIKSECVRRWLHVI